MFTGRSPEPFFKASRQTWYLQLHGRQINLGPDRELAWQRYHQIMAQPELLTRRSQDPEVEALLAEYLEWVQTHRAKATYRLVRWRLSRFNKSLPPGVTVSQLLPLHVSKWLADYPTWGSTSQNLSCRCVMAFLNWALSEGHVKELPFRKLQKPASRRRERVLSETEYFKLLEEAYRRHRCYGELLELAWETGIRPAELRTLAGKHLDLSHSRAVFPIADSKGKRSPRVIYLTERALAVLRNVGTSRQGPLLRNRNGKPWTNDAIQCLMSRLCTATGIDVALYHFRHTFATNALRRGVDPLTVSLLLGHSDPSTLTKVYQHLALDPAYLQEALVKAHKPTAT